LGMKAESTAELAALLAQAGWLRRFARALVGDASEGEDLTQETMLSAWRHPARGAGRAWLATVARNLAVDRSRSRARRERRERDQAGAHDPAQGRVASPEQLIGDAQIHRQVAEAVARLAEPFRQAVVLRFYEGLSSADIARRLGQPEGTIRWRLKEALERVRAELDARYGNDRSSWMAALAPLVTAPKAEAPASARSSLGAPGFSLLACVAAASGVLSVGTIAIVRHARAPHAESEPPGNTTMDEVASADRSGKARFALPGISTPTPTPTPTPTSMSDAGDSPGPGSVDAQALAEELLAAVQRNDYDGFVAKGSPSFRAALDVERLEGASAKLNARLSQGRRMSLLGTLHRHGRVEWLYRLEFSDDGDDALFTLAMNGWQVAGFLVTAPMPQLSEDLP
jgi:RNA polymerase sigma-70 factor (ECF subfamily)